ncbi:MAG: pyridoxamine 5'-phosphate oxidase family protein [Litorimonas sp.]
MMMRPFMPDQHRKFYNQLPFMVIGSVDDSEAPWASIVFGIPGFVTSPNDKKLVISTRPVKGDPLAKNLEPSAAISILGIEPQTRRRNRLNAVVSSVTEEGSAINVVQSFGNCPQYIQTRDMTFIRDPHTAADIVREEFTELDDKLRKLISISDTFFVASHNPIDDKHDTGGVDVNHRGGMPGFIRIKGDTLTIPDYRGNFAFNTLGNLILNPKAGLLFIDFVTGDLIQLTGTTELLLDLTEEEKRGMSAERAWRFTLDHGHRLKDACPVRWTFGEYSPRNPLSNQPTET